MPYHVTIFDMFHPGDEDAAWDDGETYRTAAAAIASVKSGVDYQLQRFWEQEVAAGGKPTVQGLVSDIHHFAELPVAFGPDHRTIFDSEAYAAERAAEMVAEAERARPGASGYVTLSNRLDRWVKPAQDIRAFLPVIVILVGLLLLLVFSTRR